MKRVLCFILMSILILNTVITPGIPARAQAVTGTGAGTAMQAAEAGATAVTGATASDTVIVTCTAAMSRADKILGLEKYDEYGIGESDAKNYNYYMNLEFPCSYLVEEAESRWGYTDVMSVINFANNEDFRLHPEYYYEAALMSLLFEQVGDQSFLDSKEQEVAIESTEIAEALLGTAVGAEVDALEELRKKNPDAFTENEYLDTLTGLQGLQDAEGILEKIMKSATDALEVVTYAQNLRKILSLQEEMIAFLEEMKSNTDNDHMINALNTVINVYRAQQDKPDNAINIVVELEAGGMAMRKVLWNSLDLVWDGICVLVPELAIVGIALSIEGFVLEQTFSSDAISDAYAKLAAIWELEETARTTVKDLGKNYVNLRDNVTEETEKLAGVFNTGWDFFTVLLDADCQAALLFAKVTYDAGIHSITEHFSGSNDYEDFAEKVEQCHNAFSIWKNAIILYMEGLNPENRKVTGATFSEHSVELNPGDTYILNMDLLPEDAADQYVEYGIVADDSQSASEEPVAANDVVKIEGNKLTAIAKGTVQIEGVAGEGKVRDTMTVNVTPGGFSKENGLYFRVEDGEAIITKYEGADTRVEIPSYISNSGDIAMFPVTEVETFTGEDGQNATVQEVVLPSSVTRIGRYAFYKCTAIKKINLENVAKIGEYAFGYCRSLETVTLKQSKTEYTEMGDFAFANCTSLKEIDISGILLANIPEGFCFGCTSLKKILWPPEVVRIRYWAFYNCGFEELSLPETIGVLEASAIDNCRNLKKLVLPSSIQKVDDDPLKFTNADDTVYYVEKYSYIHRRLEYWNDVMGYSFNVQFTEDKSDDPSGSGNSGGASGNTSSGGTLSGSGASGNTSSGGISSGSGTSDNTSSGSVASGQTTIKAKTIKKAKKFQNITAAIVGQSLQLKVKVTPANTTQKITWASSKKKVATVSQNGKVTPKKKGKTTITAKLPNGKKVTWKIIVKEIKAKKIILNKKKATLRVGDTLKLQGKLKPKGATAKIKWKSSKKKVASVSKNGKITAKKKGKAVITAQLPDGKKATCRITVKQAAKQNENNNQENTNETNGNGGNSTSDNRGGNGTSGNGGGSDNFNSGSDSSGNTGNNSDSDGGSSSVDSGSGNVEDNTGSQQSPDGNDEPAEENAPTVLTISSETLTLEGSWQALTLPKKEETLSDVDGTISFTADLDKFYGSSQMLDASITQGNDMQRIRWSSADETIAKVYSGGLVRGVSVGETMITATTTDGTTAECRVIVQEKELTWASSDENVAAVTQVKDNGKTAVITGKTKGTTTITVTSGDYKAECVLTVSDNPDAASPQPIATVEDLKAIAEDLDGNYVMTNDLNLHGMDWMPIGTADAPFTGTLDGDDHTISGLTITKDTFSGTGERYYGLFGVVEGKSGEDMAEISDLTLEGSIVLSGKIEADNIPESSDGIGETEALESSGNSGNNRMFYVGAFAAKADNGVRFDHCVSKVNITADIDVQHTEDRISLYAGGVSGESNVSGTKGNPVLFTACENHGDLNLRIAGGKSAAIINGGIIGRGGMNIKLEQCQNSGNIHADAQTAKEETSHQYVNAMAGGIAGTLISNTAVLTQCTNSGDITAYADMASEESLIGDYCLAAGIAARVADGKMVTECENTGIISVTSFNEAITEASGQIYAYPQ